MVLLFLLSFKAFVNNFKIIIIIKGFLILKYLNNFHVKLILIVFSSHLLLEHLVVVGRFFKALAASVAAYGRVISSSPNPASSVRALHGRALALWALGEHMQVKLLTPFIAFTGYLPIQSGFDFFFSNIHFPLFISSIAEQALADVNRVLLIAQQQPPATQDFLDEPALAGVWNMKGQLMLHLGG